LGTGSKDAAVQCRINGSVLANFTSVTSGAGLLEAFDVGSDLDSRFTGLSAGHSDAAEPLVAGFTIVGQNAKTLLIRGLGPALEREPFYRDSFAMASSPSTGDPAIAIFDANGRPVAENDNWEARLAPVFQRIGASSLESGSKDAALLVTLPAGAYTVVVRPNGFRRPGVLLQLFEID
jgi:hypothetical protein